MIEINLLPWRAMLKHSRQQQQIYEMMFAIIAASLILLIVHFILIWQITAAKIRFSAVQSRLTASMQQLEKIQQMYQALDYQKIPNIDLTSILHHQQKMLTYLLSIVEVIPPALTLNEMQLENNNWLLGGVSAELEAILKFTHYLNEKLKSEVKQKNTLRINQKDGIYYFHFQLELDQ